METLKRFLSNSFHTIIHQYQTVQKHTANKKSISISSSMYVLKVEMKL